MTGCLWPCTTTGRSGGLFRSKVRGPAEVVRHARELLSFVAENREACSGKHDVNHVQKMADLSKCIREMKCILYGNCEAEPIAEACTQLTKELFKENTDTLRLVIVCLPYLDLETQKDVTQVIANLQRQKVDSRMVASDYLEANQDLLDILMSGYDNTNIVIHYSTILRDSICHQVAARYVLDSQHMKRLFDYIPFLDVFIKYPIIFMYVLNSQHMKRFFDYIQFPDFSIASDSFKTFKELLTRHKSSVADFFSRNYDWFFPEFNSRLLSSSNYITRRQATQLLGDILLDRSNTTVMMRYVSSKEHLIILMNLLREQSKAIQVEAFRVFKLFTANKNKPPEVVGILMTNKDKILRFLADFTLDKEDNQFEADKSQIVAEVSAM